MLFTQHLLLRLKRCLATLSDISIDNDIKFESKFYKFEPKPFFLAANLLLQTMLVKCLPSKAQSFRARLQKLCGPKVEENKIPKLFREPTGKRLYLAALLASYGAEQKLKKEERKEMKKLIRALYGMSVDHQKMAVFFPLEWAAEESFVRHIEEFRKDVDSNPPIFPGKVKAGATINMFTGEELGTSEI